MAKNKGLKTHRICYNFQEDKEKWYEDFKYHSDFKGQSKPLKKIPYE